MWWRSAEEERGDIKFDRGIYVSFVCGVGFCEHGLEPRIQREGEGGKWTGGRNVQTLRSPENGRRHALQGKLGRQKHCQTISRLGGIYISTFFLYTYAHFQTNSTHTKYFHNVSFLSYLCSFLKLIYCTSCGNMD